MWIPKLRTGSFFPSLLERRRSCTAAPMVSEALLRLAGAVLVEAHDEWQATDRRYLGRSHHGPAHGAGSAGRGGPTPALMTA